MSTLWVVRHGQASFFEDDYDRLSPVGEEQSRRLGAHWGRRKLRFDWVVCGPRVRHCETARLAGKQVAAAGIEWPAVESLAEFDEYAAEAVLKTALPALIEQHEPIRRLQEAVTASRDRAETLRNFQRLYEVVISRWVRGELSLDDVEPWTEFRARVLRGLERIFAEAPRGANVALFTSGGPVGIAVERAVNTPERDTLQLAWMVQNGACSEFLFSADRFTMSRYNAVDHLDDPSLLTYR
jgi:broad specificity phosphatase PhoE